MPFFSSIFKGKDAAARKLAKENGAIPAVAQKPRWDDAWKRKDVEPEEIQELLRGCTYEIKMRALHMPFLLLPFRPASDPSAARTFIRNFFNSAEEKGFPMEGERLTQELRLIEPLVLCSVMKWCWSRLVGGVVTWEAYELFKIGEQDSNTARDAFATFIPISVASDARTKIIFDFFDLMAAIAAHGKTNGLGGRKLSRLAGWWAFEHIYAGNGFDGGYKAWTSAADATSHLFFAYLRSLSPDSVQGKNGISALPLSLQNLLQTTEYPPTRKTLLQSQTSKVVMIVDTVSPTPFALLRRAKHFEYREDDAALQSFSEYDDPVQALTDECRRVLKSISSANDSSNTKTSTSLRDASWSRFEDIGFSGFGEESDHDDEVDGSALGRKRQAPGLKSTPYSKTTNMGRPTTPSWADFLSSGFVDDARQNGSRLLLPPDKILPPLNTRGQSSQSHRRMTDGESTLEPGELASINFFDLDDSFWWVWISSLAGEETPERKAVFGRCALIETTFRGVHWLLLEEIVKGAASVPEEGAYIAEKKSRFGFSKRARLARSKSSHAKASAKNEPFGRSNQPSTVSIAPDQHARIQAAAAALQQKQHLQDTEASSTRRARHDVASVKTNSVFTLQPVIMTEAAPAMKWASSYDKDTIRAKYLGDNFAGKGSATDLGAGHAASANGSAVHLPPKKPDALAPPPRNESYGFQKPSSSFVDLSHQGSDQDRNLPALPRDVSPRPSNHTPTPTNEMTRAQAPLPPTPGTDQQSEVPHSTVPTAEYPRPMQRDPLPPSQQSLQQVEEPVPAADPEIFSSGPEYSKQTTTVTGGAEAPTQESIKASAKRLKKKAGPGGIKGFFGRKTKEEGVVKAPAPPPGNAAVAAARAALEAKQAAVHNQSLVGTLDDKSSRRVSTLARKPEPPVPVSREPQSTPAAEESYAPNGVQRGLPQPHYPADNFRDSQASVSYVDTLDQQHADREFGTFDQGPLDDVPAFVPEDSYQQTSPSEQHARAPTPPVEDEVSAPLDEDHRPISPVQDRWAQIRKNAAERAAKLSEEQARQRDKSLPTDRTDDGETSGEETIEARVARIKARVAELTGNMEAPGATRR